MTAFRSEIGFFIKVRSEVNKGGNFIGGSASLYVLEWLKNDRVFTMSLSYSYPLIRVGIVYCMYPWFISLFSYFRARASSWGYGDCRH